MLIIGSRLLHAPVMSLQTGTQLARIERPLIDPANLKIIAYEVSGPLLSERPSFVRTADVREYGRLGLIINGNDELCGLDDVIQIKKLHGIGFPLVGIPVIDDRKRKLGRVEDYTLETDSFVIQQITVRRGLLQSFNDTGLLISRNQIIEINNNAIVVKAPTEKVSQPVMEATRGEFVNPFRSNQPQTKPES